MGPDIDCPECGNYRVRPGVAMCSVCETAYRLGERIGQLEVERDTLRASLHEADSELVRTRIVLNADDEDTVSEAASKLKARMAELESHELEVSRLTGIVYEADYHCHAGPRDQVLGEIERLKGEARDACELRQRVAELSAPPVVPEGFSVYRDDETCWWCWTWEAAVACPEPPPVVLRAYAWAIEHDQRPPHAGERYCRCGDQLSPDDVEECVNCIAVRGNQHTGDGVAP